MRRQLTAREWMLLGVLGVLVLVSGYILLYYTPMTAERDRCLGTAESCRVETEAAQYRLDEKNRMEKELEELFSITPAPLGISDYDNLKPVMFELNSILSGTQDYTLTFGTVDTTESIVRREISMVFNTMDYESAKTVLQRLHDSSYRCMLDDIHISIGDGQVFALWDNLGPSFGSNPGNVTVTGTIVFFEYLAEPTEAVSE